MCHDIVEVSGDALAFFEDRALGALHPLSLEHARLLLERERVEVADARGVADEPGDGEDQLGLHDALQDGREASAAQEDDREDDPSEDDEWHGQLPLEPLPDRIEGDKHAKPAEEFLPYRHDRQLHDRRRDDDQEHLEREPAPDDEWQALEKE